MPPAMPTLGALQAEVDAFLPGYTVVVEPSALQRPDSAPATWVECLQHQARGQRDVGVLGWDSVLDVLPNVAFFLEAVLCGVAILEAPHRPARLAYFFTLEEGTDVYAYVGDLPLVSERLTDEQRVLWHAIPEPLRGFYSSVHDGWTTLHANAGGPARLADIADMRSVDFDLAESDSRDLAVSREQVLFCFHNGAGDYLGVDLSVPQWDLQRAGVLWFHEQPTAPEPAQDFFATLDAWFYVGVEDADGATALP